MSAQENSPSPTADSVVYGAVSLNENGNCLFFLNNIHSKIGTICSLLFLDTANGSIYVSILQRTASNSTWSLLYTTEIVPFSLVTSLYNIHTKIVTSGQNTLLFLPEISFSNTNTNLYVFTITPTSLSLLATVGTIAGFGDFDVDNCVNWLYCTSNVYSNGVLVKFFFHDVYLR